MSNVDEYIQQKLTQKIEEYIKDALERGLTKKEIGSYLLYKGHDKAMVKRMLKQLGSENKKGLHFFRKKKEEFTLQDKKKLLISSRSTIAIVMILVFILLMVVSTILTQPKSGEGTCPFVSEYNVQKVATLYFEKSVELSYMEMDELVATYLGKTDCNIIDKGTIKKLDKIKLD